MLNVWSEISSGIPRLIPCRWSISLVPILHLHRKPTKYQLFCPWSCNFSNASCPTLTSNMNGLKTCFFLLNCTSISLCQECKFLTLKPDSNMSYSFWFICSMTSLSAYIFARLLIYFLCSIMINLVGDVTSCWEHGLPVRKPFPTSMKHFVVFVVMWGSTVCDTPSSLGT